MGAPGFGEEYFAGRACRSSSLAGRLNVLKFLFWDKHIRKRVPAGRVLDAGCGEGLFLKYAERRGYESYGVDISPVAVQIARRGLTRSSIALADVVCLPFRDYAFDVVTCFDVLEHVLEPQVALFEMARVTARGGLFVMSTPNLESAGLKWKGRDWFGYRDGSHVSLLHSERWAELIALAGLTIVERFSDALWDPPYTTRLPAWFQHIIFKPQLPLFYLGVLPSMCSKRGENVYFVCTRD